MLWFRDLCICLMFTGCIMGMASSPCRILWSMVSLCSFLREASSFQPSSLRMPDTLTTPCAPFAHLAPCLWTLSSLSTSRLRTGSQIAPTVLHLISDQRSVCHFHVLVRTSLEVASNTTKHLVSLCRCLFNVCGPFEILCQGDTQVLRLCCCCEDLIVQLLKMVAALFSNMHDLTFFSC